MKELKLLMLLMLIALYSASQGIPKKSKIVVKKDTLSGYPYQTQPNTSSKKNSPVSSAGWDGSQALLEYIGSVSEAGGNSAAMNFAVGAQFAIDTTIGLRYDLVLQNGNAVWLHTAIFYKFSNPTQSVLYNYLTHQSHIINYSGVQDSGPDVDVLGSAMIDSIACTHLQHGGGTKEVSDYWMSTNVPGFFKLVNALKNISPALPTLAFSGNVFRWGGLVKWTIIYNNPKTGETFNMELHLEEANTDVTLGPDTFQVPSK